jgi:hypothetical protein
MINKNIIYVRDNMNYRKLYDAICYRGQEKRKLDYFEKHHIVPKCIGGNDDKNNLTELTAREHYIVHWLLHKIYPDNWKIAHAFLWMATENGKNKRAITSTQYSRAKKAMANSCSIRMKDVSNPMHNEEAKKKISERMKGDNNPMRKFPERNHILNGGLTPSMGGAKWFNNGTESRYYRPSDTVPAGWSEGMAFYGNRGKWITNGKEVKRLKDGQQMPDGFTYGKKKNI